MKPFGKIRLIISTMLIITLSHFVNSHPYRKKMKIQKTFKIVLIASMVIIGFFFALFDVLVTFMRKKYYSHMPLHCKLNNLIFPLTRLINGNVSLFFIKSLFLCTCILYSSWIKAKNILWITNITSLLRMYQWIRNKVKVEFVKNINLTPKGLGC